jgi:hypothetical protein
VARDANPLPAIRGIGGAEFAFTRRLERLSVGELRADDFEIDGILGVNFLIRAGAVLDLARTEVRPAP